MVYVFKGKKYSESFFVTPVEKSRKKGFTNFSFLICKDKKLLDQICETSLISSKKIFSDPFNHAIVNSQEANRLIKSGILTVKLNQFDYDRLLIFHKIKNVG